MNAVAMNAVCDLRCTRFVVKSQVSVGIKALPQLQKTERYVCIFGVNGTTVPGIVSPNEVRCNTPPSFVLPKNSGLFFFLFYLGAILRLPGFILD
jgi:hypothetical protein